MSSKITKNINSSEEKRKSSGLEDKNKNMEMRELMIQAGVLLGHHVSKLHPKMKPYIYGIRNMFHIIDPDKSIQKLNEAIEFLKELLKENKKIMVIGTRVHLRHLVKDLAESCGFFYVNERWLGGTFTNLPVILKRIEYWQDLERKKKEGEFEKYTKREQMQIDEEIEVLRRRFEGIKEMKGLPDAVIILDMQKDRIAAEEARKKGIPIIAIVDTNIDPDLVDYPIPANDDAYSSVKFIVDRLKEELSRDQQKEQNS